MKEAEAEEQGLAAQVEEQRQVTFRPNERVQGWSHLNWLVGILIIVSLHIYFNKLLMPCMMIYQLGTRFTISIFAYNFQTYSFPYLKRVGMDLPISL